ncbi:MAG: methylated-DNA--[protein]-cysteine S-methyltransferase [Balneolaceae bacterium]|nr:methylated-DNA--[protein]-cysteine S-methyltransferase [Balneolaceae bacterium]
MSTQINARYINSPIGVLKLEATDQALTAIKFSDDGQNAVNQPEPASAILEKARNQLKEFFDGHRQEFDIPLAPEGTDFEQQVWDQLKNIPFGKSITYTQLAQKLGDPNKVRAVGRANGQNPLPIIIPCHRVIGANNKLTGYAGGVERKRWLLQHEGVLLL